MREGVSAMMDEILVEIADFEQPHGVEQGRYRLKDSIWREFDRFAPQIPVQYRETAEDRYLAACNRVNCRPVPFQKLPIASLPLYPGYKPLWRLAIWLCSEGSESIVKVFLEKCLSDEGRPQSLGGALLRALYFACMVVEFLSLHISDSQGVVHESDFSNNWLSNQLQGAAGTDGTCLDYIAEMYCLSTESQGQVAPFKEVQLGLERILTQAHAGGDSKLRQRLSSKVPSLFSASKPTGRPAEDEDEKSSAVSWRRWRSMRNEETDAELKLSCA